MNLPILEELARELETFHDRQEELAPIIAHARDDNYDRNQLVGELDDAKLGFFAAKLSRGYYEEYRDAFLDGIAEQVLASEPQEVQSAPEQPQEQAPTVETPEVTQAPAEETPAPEEQAPSEPEAPAEPAPEQPAPPSEPEVPSDEDAAKRARLEELYALGDIPPALMDERDQLERELGVTKE